MKSSNVAHAPRFGPWLEMKSSNGRIYFYNRITEQSQWSKPKEWVESEAAAAAAKEKEKTITPPPAPPVLSQPPTAPSISANTNETPSAANPEPVQNGKTVTPVQSSSRDDSIDHRGSERRPSSVSSRSAGNDRRRPMSISRSSSRSSRSPPAKRSRTYTSSDRSSRSRSYSRRRSSTRSSRTHSRASHSTYRRHSSSDKASLPMDVSDESTPERIEQQVASTVTEDVKETPTPAPLVNGHSKPRPTVISTQTFDDLSDGEYEPIDAVECYTDEQLDAILREHGTLTVPPVIPEVIELNKEMTQLALKHVELAQELLDVVKDRISVQQLIAATRVVSEAVEARANFCKAQADSVSDGL